MSRFLLPIAIAVGGGVLFVLAVGFALGLAFGNARLTPAVPWFPVPVLLGLCGFAAWFHRRWDIGLRLPPRDRWPLLTAFAVTTMVASHAVLVLEGAAHGITRTFEAAPEGVTPFFAAVYWLGVVIAMSTASEVAFRGIVQGRLAPLIGPVAAIAVATFVNLILHRWDGLMERTLGVIAILLAWSWLRHLSGSLIATLMAHIGAIVAWDAILWTWGPWDHGAMGPLSLGITAAVGLAAFAVSLRFARQLASPPSAPRAPQFPAGARRATG
jgi:membrane protease YdiL (CAAX protease family)